MDEVQLLMLFVGRIGVVVFPDESVAGELRGVAVDPERVDPEVTLRIGCQAASVCETTAVGMSASVPQDGSVTMNLGGGRGIQRRRGRRLRGPRRIPRRSPPNGLVVAVGPHPGDVFVHLALAALRRGPVRTGMKTTISPPAASKNLSGAKLSPRRTLPAPASRRESRRAPWKIATRCPMMEDGLSGLLEVAAASHRRRFACPVGLEARVCRRLCARRRVPRCG